MARLLAVPAPVATTKTPDHTSQLLAAGALLLLVAGAASVLRLTTLMSRPA
jgi:hypothetical protein